MIKPFNKVPKKTSSENNLARKATKANFSGFKQQKGRVFDVFSYLNNHNRFTSAEILRNIAARVPLITAINNMIKQELRAFFKESNNDDPRGFILALKDKDKILSAKDRATLQELKHFFLNCGFKASDELTDLALDDERKSALKVRDFTRDSFEAFCLKILDDLLILDQMAIELGFDDKGHLYDFRALDAATIKKNSADDFASHQDYFDNFYTQNIHGTGTFVNFSYDELIFGFMNPRTDINKAFYGFSFIEQAYAVILSLVNINAYNESAFDNNGVPRGMILVSGDVPQDVFSSISDEIVSAINSPENRLRLPIISIPGAGKSAQLAYVKLESFEEMQFKERMEHIGRLITAIYGIDADVLGVFSSLSNASLNENLEGKVKASRNRLVTNILTFLSAEFNKILHIVNPEVEFKFKGAIQDDEKVLEARIESQKSYMTPNEIRKELGLAPLKNPIYDEIASSITFSTAMQEQQKTQTEAETATPNLASDQTQLLDKTVLDPKNSPEEEKEQAQEEDRVSKLRNIKV